MKSCCENNDQQPSHYTKSLRLVGWCLLLVVIVFVVFNSPKHPLTKQFYETI